MSYEKNIWQAGDVITAAKLNNIEDGIEAASNIPTYDGTVVDADDELEEVSYGGKK